MANRVGDLVVSDELEHAAQRGTHLVAHLRGVHRIGQPHAQARRHRRRAQPLGDQLG